MLSFMQNYTSIQISGRGLVDLSFVNLPGKKLPSPLMSFGELRYAIRLIHSVRHDGNPKDITLVKNLTVKYIEKQSCLILLTVSCEGKWYLFQQDSID